MKERNAISVTPTSGPHSGQKFTVSPTSVTLHVSSSPGGLFSSEDPEMVVDEYAISGDTAKWICRKG